jgi:hypothetical protein
MAAAYADRLVTIADGVLTIRRYYFPVAGSKTIPLPEIKAVRPVQLGPVRGRWRLWGMTVPGYWLNLDGSRPRKRDGFVLDLGRRIKPMVTPDDPAAFRRTMVEGGVPIVDSAPTPTL